MRPLLLIATAALLLAPGSARAEEAPAPNTAELLSRLRVMYSHSTSFAPSALRFQLRTDLPAELEAARKALAASAVDLDTRFKFARLADEADDPSATREWQVVLAMTETALKSTPDSLTLQERQVEAMIGANAAVRVVPAAQKLAAAQPLSWRAQLMLGDAYLRRADFNWRVLVRRNLGMASAAPPELLQMNEDLQAAEKAYDRTVEMAPSEPAPRAARISLLLARPLMASFLPKGSLPAPEEPDVASIRQNLVELINRSPGALLPVWHTAHFFATQSAGETPMTEAERTALEKGLAAAKAEGAEVVFLAEARGLYHFVRGEWDEARKQFEAALTAQPDRQFAAEWLGMTEVNSRAPRDVVVARARMRLAAHPRSQDWILVGIMLPEEERSAATDALRKAIELEVDNANARYNLALLLLRANHESIEARHHLSRALEVRPDDREAQYALAVTRLLDGNTREARTVIQGMLRLPDLEGDLRKRAESTLKEIPAPAAPKAVEVQPAPNPK